LPEFLHVISSEEFVRHLSRFARPLPEHVSLDAALQRLAAADLTSPEDLPEWARSTVDGYAVRAEDTFGASDSIPCFLEVTAAVEMGMIPDAVLRAGQAAQIPTGGFVPRGADAVVMVEYTNHAGGSSIEVSRPVTAGANVLEKGEDVKSGETVVRAGRVLRAQELGLLAALGIDRIPVYRRPRVAVISTGDEIVSVGKRPLPGQIRDANSHSISALVASSDATPVVFDIVPDDTNKLRESLEKGLELGDLVVLSGGSSVGVRDLMVDVVSSLAGAKLLAHGVAIRPGKPTMLAEWKGKAIFGLPGHPVSALIAAQVFLVPFLRYLQGSDLEKGPLGRRTKAELASPIHSIIGLEEFIRVGLTKTAKGAYFAHPVFGKSSMLSTMVKADGLVVVPMNAEGFAGGDTVEVVGW
jgi:molybdopterin molybdotransferase